MMTSVSVASLELRMSAKKQGGCPSRSFLARGSICRAANRVKELYGRTSQANVNSFGAWLRLLWSMDLMPHRFFIDSGIRRKKLESVAGVGPALAPDRTFSILVVGP